MCVVRVVFVESVVYLCVLFVTCVVCIEWVVREMFGVIVECFLC